MHDVLQTLREYLATCDQARFTKEAAYSSLRIRGRIAEKTMNVEDAFDSEGEGLKRSYLRRKTRQGRQDSKGA